jgi:hypothetical protein
VPCAGLAHGGAFPKALTPRHLVSCRDRPHLYLSVARPPPRHTPTSVKNSRRFMSASKFRRRHRISSNDCFNSGSKRLRYCNMRCWPRVRCGSFVSILCLLGHVCFASDSDCKADIPSCLLSANRRHSHRSTLRRYSITSSARARSEPLRLRDSQIGTEFILIEAGYRALLQAMVSSRQLVQEFNDELIHRGNPNLALVAHHLDRNEVVVPAQHQVDG